MEHKHKIMATVGCESEGTCMVSENMIDRLSNLPDGVAYHILSFLTIEDLARVGCVSKRCKELYISTPSLNFKFYNQDTSTCNKRLWLLNSLDRFLVHRGDNKIQYFRVSWRSHSVNQSQELPCFCDDENFQMILAWIQNAVRCNVEELVLKISSPAEVTPLSMMFIFLCASLKSLVLKMFCTIHEAPSFAVSSNLKYLKLKNVGIDDEGFFKWISCCCKFIEELILEEVHGINTITIESSSLKIFGFYFPVDICHLNISCEKLDDIVIDWRFDERSNISLYIFAPNLRKLMWYGNVMNQRNLGKLECLEEVILDLVPEVDYQNVYGLLCNLRWVRILIIDVLTIQVKRTMTLLLIYYFFLGDILLFEFFIFFWYGDNRMIQKSI